MEKTIFNLSQTLWNSLLAADKSTAAEIIHDNAVFVHMGATFDKAQELAAIGDLIKLKQLEMEEQSVRFVGETAILLKKIKLTAEVKGEIVTNPFVVTETYAQQSGQWKLAAMAYTRILY